MAQLKAGTTIGGYLAWHAGNMGQSSGLDADLLDGKHLTDLKITLIGGVTASETAFGADGTITINTSLTAHTHDDRYYTESESDSRYLSSSDSRITDWNTAYTHSQAAHARTDATLVQSSSTNGNIKINGTETTVYTHPTTAGNVHIPSGGAAGNFLKYASAGTATWSTPAIADISGLQTALDGKASTSHNHDAAYLGISAKAADSDKLDNIDSTGFLRIITDGTTDKVTASNSRLGVVGGTNISITYDDTNKKITIANTYSYTHPTGDGNLHVPATGTSNNNKVLKAGATAGTFAWGNVDWSELTNKPSTFAPSAHTHPNTEITGLGGAATLNVGTTSGTVAAGNDSRFHSNANDPTSDQKAALAGTSGTPSSTNKYVTNADSRLSDARAPTSHGNEAHSSTFVTQTDINNSISTHAGNATAHHSNANDPTADQKAALAGTSGTPSASNKYVTNADSRLSDARTPTAHSHAATDITSGTLATARGGTGLTSFTSGSYFYASSTSAIGQKTPAQVLSDIGAAPSTDPGLTTRSGTAPSSPVEGQLWYDTTNDALKVYNGSEWVAAGGTTYDADQVRKITISDDYPSGGSDGDIWFRYF